MCVASGRCTDKPSSYVRIRFSSEICGSLYPEGLLLGGNELATPLSGSSRGGEASLLGVDQLELGLLHLEPGRSEMGAHHFPRACTQ